MLVIPGDIRVEDAALQPRARPRLEDDRFGHDDLLSGRKAQKEIRIMWRIDSSTWRTAPPIAANCT
jgi:hypothetical protein